MRVSWTSHIRYDIFMRGAQELTVSCFDLAHETNKCLWSQMNPRDVIVL